MNLKELKKEIPYQWRVQSFSKFNATAQCVAYIDARDVMNLLDEVVGAENWASDFKDIGGQTFAGIGIKLGESFVWKWDTGSESNIEKEKGQASDSLKRAAVQWGIGRFLYDLDIKKVKTNEPKGDKNTPYVVDETGNRVWDLSKYINGLGHAPTTKSPAKQPVEPPKTPLTAAQSAKKAIGAASDLESLHKLREQVTNSTKLTDDEKNALIEEIVEKTLTFDPIK